MHVADHLAIAKRSENMRRIRSNDTGPELTVRRIVHAMGIGYRLHHKELPGKPDLAFIGRRKAIFVHGCFWHQHGIVGCSDSRVPKSRPEYWLPKLGRNVARDEEHLANLRALGWRVLVIWDCETTQTSNLAERLRAFLE